MYAELCIQCIQNCVYNVCRNVYAMHSKMCIQCMQKCVYNVLRIMRERERLTAATPGSVRLTSSEQDPVSGAQSRLVEMRAVCVMCESVQTIFTTEDVGKKETKLKLHSFLQNIHALHSCQDLGKGSSIRERYKVRRKKKWSIPRS